MEIEKLTRLNIFPRKYDPQVFLNGNGAFSDDFVLFSIPLFLHPLLFRHPSLPKSIMVLFSVDADDHERA